MNVLAKVTDESEFLRESVVCLDGFTGFTPTQYAFLERLIQTAKKVYITVTIDRRASIVRPEAKHGLFYLSQKTLYRIRKLAEEDLSVTLAISLHAATDEKRKQLMPVAKKYSIKELIAASGYAGQEIKAFCADIALYFGAFLHDSMSLRKG